MARARLSAVASATNWITSCPVGIRPVKSNVTRRRNSVLVRQRCGRDAFGVKPAENAVINRPLRVGAAHRRAASQWQHGLRQSRCDSRGQLRALRHGQEVGVQAALENLLSFRGEKSAFGVRYANIDVLVLHRLLGPKRTSNLEQDQAKPDQPGASADLMNADRKSPFHSIHSISSIKQPPHDPRLPSSLPATREPHAYRVGPIWNQRRFFSTETPATSKSCVPAGDSLR